MMIAVWFAVFIASTWMLVRAADYFTDYAAKLGKILRLPNFIVGVFIVALGTSLPELVTSVIGVSRGETEVLSGTVLGTVVINILLGLGIAVLLSKKKTKFSWDIVSNDLPFFAGAIFLIAIALLDGKFGMFEGIIFIVGYITYVVYAYFIQKEEGKTAKADIKRQLNKEIKGGLKEAEEKDEKIKQTFKLKGFSPNAKIILFLIVSLGFIILSSNFVIEAVLQLASIFGIGASIIAATAVALGTSLPEIVVVAAAAKRGNFDMAIGDILGANIFDIFVIYGVNGLFVTLTITSELYWIMIPFLIGTFFLLWLVLIDKKITRTEALMFVLVYIFFVGKLLKLF
ncbi:calcium/sodium antiporter [Candidatus Kuenenbacteria bacterium]|nr:calcium/sodium antiporter [Candidatus Kuenenbacteria bacterium]